MESESCEKSTPRPWNFDIEYVDEDKILVDFYGATGKREHFNQVFLTPGGTKEDRANAELILTAVNSYDSLRSEIKKLRELLFEARLDRYDHR